MADRLRRRNSTAERVTVDAGGTLYIADTGNNRVRKISPDGAISTLAGNGTRGFSGDGGAAMERQLSSPAQTLLDAAGNLYLADFGNYRVRRISADGVIATVAGNGIPDLSPIQFPQIGDGAWR